MKKLIAVLLVLAACKTRQDRRREELERQAEQLEQALDELEAQLGIYDAGVAEPVPVEEEEPAPAPAVAEEPSDEPCIDPTAITSVRFASASSTICDQDRCYTVAKDTVRPGAALPEVAYGRSDLDIAEVCPAGRACTRFSPSLPPDEGSVLDVFTSDDGAYGVAVIATNNVPTAIEILDVARGRRVGAADIAELGAHGRDELDVQVMRGAVIVMAFDPSTDLGRGWLLGLDGKRRAVLGGAQGRLRNWAVTDRMVATFVLGDEDIATVTGYDLATGKVIGTHAVTPVPDTFDDMDEAGGKSVALVHTDGRLDVVDLGTGKLRSRTVPICQ